MRAREAMIFLAGHATGCGNVLAQSLLSCYAVDCVVHSSWNV